jgi:hypothetical protein
MRNLKSLGCSVLGVLMLASFCTNAPVSATADQSVLSHSQSDCDVAIRFWALPPNPDTIQGPLVLLPVSSQDPRLDTKPAWTLYVRLSDLHSVARALADSKLQWKESNQPQKMIVDPLQLPHLHRDTMQIAISYPAGSAEAEVTGDGVQLVLSKAYCALESQKARENMRVWTGPIECSRVVSH